MAAFPEGVVFFGISAFNGCSSLTSVPSFPARLTLGSSCFAQCPKLDEATVEMIKNRKLFYTYKGLKDEKIPEDLETLIILEGVTKIHDEVFRGRKFLKAVLNFPPSLTEIGKNAFWNVPLLHHWPLFRRGLFFLG